MKKKKICGACMGLFEECEGLHTHTSLYDIPEHSRHLFDKRLKKKTIKKEKVIDYLNPFNGEITKMTKREYDEYCKRELPGIVSRLYETSKTLNLSKERKEKLMYLYEKYGGK